MALLKHIPNLLTLSNLFLGLLAIIASFKGAFETAAVMICLSGLADFFDGMVARWVKADGELGKQLDSLADVISFGVAPSMALWSLSSSITEHWSSYIILTVPLFTAMRLAKFNIDPEQSTVFKGLPSPAAGLALISVAAASDTEVFHSFYPTHAQWFLPMVSLGFGLLMVSPLRMFSLKINKGSSSLLMPSILLLSALFLISTYQWAGLSMTMLIYVILSIVHTFAFAKKHQ